MKTSISKSVIFILFGVVMNWSWAETPCGSLLSNNAAYAFELIKLAHSQGLIDSNEFEKMNAATSPYQPILSSNSLASVSAFRIALEEEFNSKGSDPIWWSNLKGLLQVHFDQSRVETEQKVEAKEVTSRFIKPKLIKTVDLSEKAIGTSLTAFSNTDFDLKSELLSTGEVLWISKNSHDTYAVGIDQKILLTGTGDMSRFSWQSGIFVTRTNRVVVVITQRTFGFRFLGFGGKEKVKSFVYELKNGQLVKLFNFDPGIRGILLWEDSARKIWVGQEKSRSDALHATSESGKVKLLANLSSDRDYIRYQYGKNFIKIDRWRAADYPNKMKTVGYIDMDNSAFTSLKVADDFLYPEESGNWRPSESERLLVGEKEFTVSVESISASASRKWERQLVLKSKDGLEELTFGSEVLRGLTEAKTVKVRSTVDGQLRVLFDDGGYGAFPKIFVLEMF